jgi:hypothetical protein
MLNIPRLSVYRNTEFIGFMTDVLDFANAANVAALTDKVAALQSNIDIMNNSFKAATHSDLTKDVQALDLRRDNAIKGIKTIATAHRFYANEANINASTSIVNSIDKYGQNIARFNYQAQTVTLQSLINDWENDADFQAALTLLHLNDWVAELKTANEAFKTIYQDRVTDMANKQRTAVSELRPATTEAYITLVKHIEANDILNPSAALTNLIGQLNELVNKYNAI